MQTVLFADDMEGVRNVSCAALRQQGYTVLAARDGFEALSMAREHPDPIDLLITDVIMPRLSGPELCRALKDCHPEARVLYISGYPADQLDGAASFLQKPFTPRVMLRRVSELLSEPSAALVSDPTVSASERQIQNLRMALDRNAPTDRTRIGYSVLLISQYPEDKDLLQEFLAVLPCSLESASSWAAAMPTLKHQSFGVVVCESQLPDSTWEQVLSYLAGLVHPPPLIVISRLADERLWAAVLNQCGFDVLAKPLARAEVVHVVGHALDHCKRIGVQREIHTTRRAWVAQK